MLFTFERCGVPAEGHAEKIPPQRADDRRNIARKFFLCPWRNRVWRDFSSTDVKRHRPEMTARFGDKRLDALRGNTPRSLTLDNFLFRFHQLSILLCSANS